MCPGRERGGFKPESLSAAVGCAQGFSQLAARHGGARQYQVLYRRPHGTEWETLDLDTAMDMIAVGSWTRAAGAGSRRWTGTGWAEPAWAGRPRHAQLLVAAHGDGRTCYSQPHETGGARNGWLAGEGNDQNG